MSLAAAVLAEEDEPALRVARPRDRSAVRTFEALAVRSTEAHAIRDERVERERSEPFARHRTDLHVGGLRLLAEFDQLRQRRVGEPHGQTSIEVGRLTDSGKHRGQHGIESVRHQLEELLARPRRLRVCVEVVEYEEWRAAHLFEQRVVLHLGVIGIRRAKVVEEVGDGHKQRRFTAFDHGVRDRGGNVRLPAAVGTGEHQPALGLRGEALGDRDSLAVRALGTRIARATGAEECREGEALQRAETGVAGQAVAALLPVFIAHAAAWHGLTETRVIRIRGDAHEPCPVAVHADRGGLDAQHRRVTLDG